MKEKLVMTVMIGLLFLSFLSSIAEAAPAGLPECTNSLNICTTNLTNAQTNLATCQNNAQTNLTACQANLATCQATLGECSQKVPPPSWYQKIPCDSKTNCPRFEVLADWYNNAVLDKETGLVWEKSPTTDLIDWDTAQGRCSHEYTGGRFGWRLPTLQELESLVDRTQNNPSLPAGHPFTSVQTSDNYWSATSYVSYTGDAWYVNFYVGDASPDLKSHPYHYWCVRGGQGVEAQ